MAFHKGYNMDAKQIHDLRTSLKYSSKPLFMMDLRELEDLSEQFEEFNQMAYFDEENQAYFDEENHL